MIEAAQAADGNGGAELAKTLSKEVKGSSLDAALGV